MVKYIQSSLAVVMLTALASAGQSQELPASAWNGEWIAEGTLFQIAVRVENQVITVSEIESLGFIWSSEEGEVSGSVARLPVQHAGAAGVIQVELLDATTAVAHAASCMPDFMVVCALSRNRQAIFRKVEDPN